MPALRPHEVRGVFLEAFNRADVEALVALHEPNAIFSTASGIAVGHDAIRQAYQQILAGGGQMQLQTRTVLESGDGLALLHGSWTFRRHEYVSSGMSTEVVRRQADGTWLFVLDEPRTPQNPGV